MQRIPAPVLFIVGAVSQYAGAAAAVLLFAEVPAEGVAWLRVLAAALVLSAWRRPWRALRGSSRRRLGLIAAFGTVLALMNTAFYLAIAELPLGTAVAIEFLGPVAVAALGTRSRRDVAAFSLAVLGVALLADVRLVDGRIGSAPGVAFALLAAALWAGYILLGSRVAGGGAGIDGLAAGLVAGTLAVAPLGAPAALPALVDPRLLGVCLAVGVLSSVVPYALDQVVLTRMAAGRFALLLALLPATAAVVGAVVLRQTPSAIEAAGIGLVVAAVAVRTPAPPSADGAAPRRRSAATASAGAAPGPPTSKRPDVADTLST